MSDTGVLPKIDSLMYVGAPKSGEIKKSMAIIATGRNLAFNAALGDSVTLNWTESDEAKTATITPA